MKYALTDLSGFSKSTSTLRRAALKSISNSTLEKGTSHTAGSWVWETVPLNPRVWYLSLLPTLAAHLHPKVTLVSSRKLVSQLRVTSIQSIGLLASRNNRTRASIGSKRRLSPWLYPLELLTQALYNLGKTRWGRGSYH
jgi:hypothetical protein